MFGILMGLLHIGARTAVGISGAIEEADSKNRCREAGYDFYVDRNGCKRRLSNDEPVFERRDWRTGHIMEINPYNGHVYRDLTDDARRMTDFIAKEKAIMTGKRFYAFEKGKNNPHPTHMLDKIKGYRYKDLKKPGEIYVRRRVSNSCCGGVPWYLNIKTGMYEAPAVECIRNDSYWEDIYNKKMYYYSTSEEIEKLKNRLNELQEKYIREHGFNSYLVWRSDNAHIWDDYGD